MILGNLQNLEQDRLALAPALVRGLEYLNNTDFSKIENGRYEIDGSNLIAIVQEYHTSAKEVSEAESHCKYIDIQYIHQGAETIGYGLLNQNCKISRDDSAKSDAIIYQTVPHEVEIILTAGMYAVFFPTDIHRPCCHFGSGGQVKKVVLKVAKTLLHF